MERADKLHVIGAPLEFPRNATLWIEKKSYCGKQTQNARLAT